MALKPPNMEDSCTPKRRCLAGPNKGLAYDPAAPCLTGQTFDELKCDCIDGFGWVYAYHEGTGYCYEFSGVTPIQCCGSNSTTNAVYVGEWITGPPPTYTWTASTSWESAGGQTSGTMGLNESITVLVKTGISATSDNTPWDAPVTWPAVSGPTGTCTLPFVNCGAVNEAGCRSVSTLTMKVFQYDQEECDCSDLSLSTPTGRSQCIRRCLGL